MQPVAKHIVGVDGGGSTCRVAISTTNGVRLGGAVGPSANPATSMDEAVTCLLASLEAARLDAGLTPEELRQAVAYMGLAGVINDDIAAQVSAAMPFETLAVVEDRATNMDGALGGQDGFIAALGTGSFFGCQRGGRQRYVGGWGIWLSDHASGAWIGRALLSRILEWRDGMHASSDLMEEVFADFGMDPARIVFQSMQASPFEYGQLAPRVLDAASKGDAAGLAIMGASAKHVQEALTCLGFRSGDLLCLTGGVGARMAPFLDETLTANLMAPQGTALDGALRLAARLAARDAP